MTAPQINPGEIANWPLLKIVYRTDHDKIADLLPPGIEPGRRTERAREHLQRAGQRRARIRRVHEGPGALRGRARLLRDRSRHRPGVGDLHQPGAERPAQVPVLHRVLPPRRRRRGALHAPGVHVPRVPRAGHRRRRGRVRRVRGPRVVDQVVARRGRSREELRLPAPRRRRRVGRRPPCARSIVDGTLVLRDSPWDPYTTLLPMREHAVRRPGLDPDGQSREITLAGPLDPLAFWPYADTIGGSRWPGFKGGPRFDR